MNSRGLTVLLVAGFGLAAVLPATAYERGTTGADFLKIGLGAAPAGAGEAYTARTGDVHAAFYNPAGLAGLERPAVAATHLRWIAETWYEAVAYAQPLLGMGTLGAGLFLLHMPEIPGRDDQGRDTGALQVYDLGVQFSYARDLAVWLGAPDYAAGANVKILHRELAGHSATGAALDLGFRAEPLPGLAFGLAGSNFGYLSAFTHAEETLPVVIRVGASYSPSLGAGHEVVASLDAVQPLDNALRAHVGATYTYADTVSLRAGYIAGADLAGLQAGAGVTWRSITLDYAVKGMDVFGPTHFVTATFGFGASIRELSERRAEALLAEAESLSGGGQYTEALAKAEEAVAVAPSHEEALHMRDKLRTVLQMLELSEGNRPASPAGDLPDAAGENLTPDELEERGWEVQP